MSRSSSRKIVKKFDSKDKAKLIHRALGDKKAVDLVCLDVSKFSPVTDFILIATGTSDRHVKAMGQGVLDCLYDLGEKPVHKEGFGEGSWVLLDSPGVMVHIFQEESRVYYGLEKLWHKGEKVRFR